MEILKNKEPRKMSLLEKARKRVARRNRRERLHRVLIAGLSVLAVAAFAGGHISGRYCRAGSRL